LDPENEGQQILANLKRDMREILEFNLKRNGEEGELPIISEILTNLSKVGIDRREQKHMKALAGLVLHYQQQFSPDNNDYYQAHLDIVCDILGIAKGRLVFLMDLIDGSPNLIFQVKKKDVPPRINIKNWTTNAEFEIGRISLLCDVLGVRRTVINKLAAAWMHSYNTILQGEKAMVSFAVQMFKIEPVLIDFIMKTQFSHSREEAYFDAEHYNYKLRIILKNYLN